MSRIASRLERLEASHPAEFTPSMSFLWAGGHNDAALEEAKREAEAKGCDLMIIELVSPELDENGRAIRK